MISEATASGNSGDAAMMHAMLATGTASAEAARAPRDEQTADLLETGNWEKGAQRRYSSQALVLGELVEHGITPLRRLVVGRNEAEWRAGCCRGHASLAPDVVLADLQIVARTIHES